MIKVVATGDFRHTSKFLNKIHDVMLYFDADKYGRMGVAALRDATPRDTGKTAESWDYNIKRRDGALTIEWTNSNIQNGILVAILIQYGHGTRNGTYVSGIDYINPALEPVFKKMADDAWKEVTKL